MKILLAARTRIRLVSVVIFWLNLVLNISRRIVFGRGVANPTNILIYKVGNIGDIICAVPSLIAIRRKYPNAKITLLTSPALRQFFGAGDLLRDVWYIDELKIYYLEDIKTFSQKNDFWRGLKNNRYDFFIQLPDRNVRFRTLLRNIFFAKLLGANSAFGFKVRDIKLFKRAQIERLFEKTEVESLLDMLKENGISDSKAEFDLNIPPDSKEKIKNLLERKWGKFNKGELVVAVNPGAKKPSSRWPAERFGEAAKYLQEKHGAKIVMVGGKDEMEIINIAKRELNEKNLLIAAGQIDALETVELFKYCSFLISNDTGAVHMAAVAGLPVVEIYCLREIPGSWFPYGVKYKVIYHKLPGGDYQKEESLKKSIETVSVSEVINACEEFLKETSF